MSSTILYPIHTDNVITKSLLLLLDSVFIDSQGNLYLSRQSKLDGMWLIYNGVNFFNTNNISGLTFMSSL